MKTVIKARVTVTLKNGVLDPQGKAIEGALSSLALTASASSPGQGFRHRACRDDRSKAEATLKAMCEKLLANTVIENYAFTLS